MKRGNLFAKHFNSVFIPSSTLSYRSHPDYATTVYLSNLNVSLAELFNAIKALESNKSAGDDGLSPVFVKSCNFSLSRAIWTIFSREIECCGSHKQIRDEE